MTILKTNLWNETRLASFNLRSDFMQLEPQCTIGTNQFANWFDNALNVFV